MNYKNQMLKQLASGSFGKKTYMDIVRNKGNINKNKTRARTNNFFPINNTEPDNNKLIDNEQKLNKINSDDIDTDNYVKQIGTVNNGINENTDNINENTDNINENMNSVNENTDISSNSDIFIERRIFLEPKQFNSDTTNRIKNLEDRVSELENYIVVMVSETEKLKNSQKNMIDVINKLSNELFLVKNKITG